MTIGSITLGGSLQFNGGAITNALAVNHINGIILQDGSGNQIGQWAYDGTYGATLAGPGSTGNMRIGNGQGTIFLGLQFADVGLATGGDGALVINKSFESHGTYFALNPSGGPGFLLTSPSGGLLALTTDGSSGYCDARMRTLILDPVAVAGLPGSPVKGQRAYVTDATATTFNSIVAGSGSNNVPVHYDGTNWRIG